MYEVENVDDPCYVTLAVNPKEYFEYFKSNSTNKKHKEIKKGSKGMDFEHYAERIKSLKNFDSFEQSKNEYKRVGRFVVKKGEMVTTSVVKTKFSQLNDKRFYFPNAIISLPYGHPSLREIADFKKEKGQKIEIFLGRKRKTVQNGKKGTKKCIKT